MRSKRTTEERFWQKVNKTETCWLWTGWLDSSGYGCFQSDTRRAHKAHRWAYEHLVGPIPSDRELDHVKSKGCTSRACVWPEHLEVVTHQENMRRANLYASGSYHRSKTHCAKGHPFSEANTYVYKKTGERHCRTCDRLRKALS